MRDFIQYTPTEVIFGRDTERKTADYVKKYGGGRVLVVYGGGSAVRSGLLDRVTATLDAAGLSWRGFGGAKPNPTLSHARRGVEVGAAFGADFVLALGGGSAIDTAKAIAHGLANPDADLWDFWSGACELTRTTPVGVVLTIPAAGSEMSDSAVLTNEAIPRKKGLSTDLNRPVFAVMNPALALTLPPYQVACGITDIMMHTLDRYFNPYDNALTDALAEALLRTVIDQGRKITDDPTDYDAMSELEWASSLSHNGLTGLGGQKDFAAHQLGHEISARFDLAHGASLAAVWGALSDYVRPARPERFARYARNVWEIQNPDDEAAGRAGIAATVDYFARLGMPTGFGACIGIQSDETIRDMAWRCTYEGTRTIGTYRILEQSDVEAIYRAANH